MKKKFSEILNQNVENNTNSLNEKVYVFDYEDDPQMKNASELTDYMRRMYGYSSMYNLSQKELRQRELNDKKIDYAYEKAKASKEREFELDKKNLDWKLDMKKEMNRHNEKVNDSELNDIKDERNYNVNMNKNRFSYDRDTYNKWQEYITNRDKYYASNYEKNLEYKNDRYQSQLDYNYKKLSKEMDKAMKEIELEYNLKINKSKDAASIKQAEAQRDAQVKAAEFSFKASEAKIAPAEYQMKVNEEAKDFQKKIKEIYDTLTGARLNNILSAGTYSGMVSPKRVMDAYLKSTNLDLVDEFYKNATNNVTKVDVPIKNNTYVIDFANENGVYVDSFNIPFCGEDAKAYEKAFDTLVANKPECPFKIGQGWAYLNYIAEHGINPSMPTGNIPSYVEQGRRNANRRRNRRLREEFNLTSEYEKNLIFGNILENINDVVSMSEADLRNVNKNLVSAASKVAASKYANPSEKALLVNATLGQIRKNDSEINDKDPLVITEADNLILQKQRKIENDRKRLKNKIENNNKIEDIDRKNIEKQQEEVARLKEVNKAISTETNGEVASNQSLSTL